MGQLAYRYYSWTSLTDSSYSSRLDVSVGALGGGSVMDTAKAANFYAAYPQNFYDCVNPPLGKGLPVPGRIHTIVFGQQLDNHLYHHIILDWVHNSNETMRKMSAYHD
jgi:hypothetical protein